MYKHHQWEHHSYGVGSRLPWSICIHSLRKPAAMSADVAEPPFLLVNWTWISTSTACERRLSFSLSFWSVPSFVIFVHKVHEPEPPFMQLYSCYMCRGYSATRTTGLCSWNMGIILNHHGNNTEHFSGNHQEQKNDITNKHGKATKLVVAGSTSKEPCGCTDINAENPPFVDFSERETIGFPHFLHVYPT